MPTSHDNGAVYTKPSWYCRKGAFMLWLYVSWMVQRTATQSKIKRRWIVAMRLALMVGFGATAWNSLPKKSLLLVSNHKRKAAERHSERKYWEAGVYEPALVLYCSFHDSTSIELFSCCLFFNTCIFSIFTLFQTNPPHFFYYRILTPTMPSLSLLKIKLRDDSPPTDTSPTVIALGSITTATDSQSTADSFLGNLSSVSASNSQLSIHTISGIVIGCFFFLFFGAILYCILRRKKYPLSSEGTKAGMQRRPPILSRQSVLRRNGGNVPADSAPIVGDPVNREGNETPPPQYSERGAGPGYIAADTRDDIPLQTRAGWCKYTEQWTGGYHNKRNISLFFDTKSYP